MTSKELSSVLEDEVNVYGCEQKMKDTAENITWWHRTLQQNLIGRFVIPLIIKMAKNYRSGDYDARNETALKMCSIMSDALSKEYPYINEDSSLPCI